MTTRNNTRDPIYKHRRVAPESAMFDERCYRVSDTIALVEANSNVYLLETPAGNVLINAGMGFEAPVIEHNLQSLGCDTHNIHTIITTQGHVDHVGGVSYFKSRNPDAIYIAQANNTEHQQYDARLAGFRAARAAFRFKDSFTQVFQRYAERGYTQLNAQDQPTPDVTFTETYDFELGGVNIELIAVAGAETNDSLIIWLPQTNTLFSGNLFGCAFGHFPNLVTIRGDRYRDALVCAAAADRVLALGAETLLYGHHEPIVGAELIEREVTVYRDAIHYVHDQVIAGMNAGQSLTSLQSSIHLPPELEVGEGYGKLSWSIRAIWEHYAGWFKHLSTTELYTVPVTSVHADIVALAGADALVGRAREKLLGGECEQALHLLDIVLNVDSSNAAASVLAIEVHRALLKNTNNFWLSGWLENQIKLLQGEQTDPLAY